MKKEAFDNLFLNLIEPDQNYLPILYGKKVHCIQDFIYPSDPTPLRPGNGKTGKKMPNGPQYIVIHDTGMTKEEDNAIGLNRYIHQQANKKDGRIASWHFSIDDSNCYQHVPTDEIAWHAGDGSNSFLSTYFNTYYQKECIGGGNQNGIGIETCINPQNDYELTLKRTARLVAELLHEHKLDIDRVKQHHDFSGKECPNVIRNTEGLWESLIRDIELEYKLIAIDPNATLCWKIDKNEIIGYNGKKKTPNQKTLVTINLVVTSEQIDYEYRYAVHIKGITLSEIGKRLGVECISRNWMINDSNIHTNFQFSEEQKTKIERKH